MKKFKKFLSKKVIFGLLLVLTVGGFFYLSGKSSEAGIISFFQPSKQEIELLNNYLAEKESELNIVKEENIVLKEKLEAERKNKAEIELKHRMELEKMSNELDTFAKTIILFNERISEMEESEETDDIFITDEDYFCFIDINNASQKELEDLTGVGPVIAQRIIENRPFYSIYGLINVPGIGDKTLEKIVNQGCAYVDEADREEDEFEEEEEKEIEDPLKEEIADVCPININNASKEDLGHLTGVGPVIAQRIIENRPFYSIYDLIKVSGIGEVTLTRIIEQDCAYVDTLRYSGSGGSSRVVSSDKEYSPEINLLFNEKKHADEEIKVNLLLSNLKEAQYDIKISIEKDGILSEIYNEKEEKWQSSLYYLTEVFTGDLFEDEFRLKIRESRQDFRGEAEILVRVRETGKSSFIGHSEIIKIIEPKEKYVDEKNGEEEDDSKDKNGDEPKTEIAENLLKNEFFEEWEDNIPIYWDKGEHIGDIYQSTSTKAFTGEYSLGIKHNFIGPRNIEQYTNKTSKELGNFDRAYGEIWVKGAGFIRIGIKAGQENFSHGDWRKLEDADWTKITYDRPVADTENFWQLRIQTTKRNPDQHSDIIDVNLQIGAAWLGTDKPFEGWLP